MPDSLKHQAARIQNVWRRVFIEPSLLRERVGAEGFLLQVAHIYCFFNAADCLKKSFFTACSLSPGVCQRERRLRKEAGFYAGR